MATRNQDLGDWGEKQVAKLVHCPVCHEKSLKQLEANFPSLDLVCRNCAAYMAQVKSVQCSPDRPDRRPATIRGAGWNPLQTQIAVGQLRDLYVVGGVPTARGWKLAWIDRVPGAALLANAHIYEHRVARINDGARMHPMFNINYAKIPPACVMTVIEG